MSLHKYDLGLTSHFGRALEERLDIPRFVACRNDDRNHRFLLHAPGGRSRYDNVGQGKMVEWPQANKEAVCEPTQWQWEENLPRGSYRFKPGKHQQGLDVLRCQPVLIEIGRGQVQLACAAQRRLPEAAVEVEKDAGARVAERPDLLEDALHIPQVVDQV